MRAILIRLSACISHLCSTSLQPIADIFHPLVHYIKEKLILAILIRLLSHIMKIVHHLADNRRLSEQQRALQQRDALDGDLNPVTTVTTSLAFSFAAVCAAEPILRMILLDDSFLL